MSKELWLMPFYYKNFKCKCDKCRHTCCNAWKIRISQQEYFNLIGMGTSEKLHHKIEDSFCDPKTPSEDCFKYISYNWLGECPMFEDGLCLLHKEKGPDALPNVCKLYPRSLKRINNQLIACCSSSCEAVVELLYKSNEYKLIKDELNEEAHINYSFDEDLIQDINHYNQILKNNGFSLVQKIKTICLEVNEDEFNNEYNTDINPLFEALSIFDKFANNDDFLQETNKLLKERYMNNSKQYEIDKVEFENTYSNWMSFFENVINNSLIYECFPFVDERISKTDAFKGLCVTYGLLRLIAIGYTSINKNEESLIDSVASLFRLIEHTSFYYNVNIISKNAAILLNL